MLSLLFVLLIPTPSTIFFRCILYVTGCGFRTLEAGLGTLVFVSVAVVDARTIPWSGRTTPRKSFRLPPPRKSFHFPPLSESLFKRRWLSIRYEIHFAWANANSDKSWAIVSVRAATVALSAAVDVARLARASTFSAW